MDYELERYELLCSHIIFGYNPVALSVSLTYGLAASKLAELYCLRERTSILIWAEKLEKILTESSPSERRWSGELLDAFFDCVAHVFEHITHIPGPRLVSFFPSITIFWSFLCADLELTSAEKFATLRGWYDRVHNAKPLHPHRCTEEVPNFHRYMTAREYAYIFLLRHAFDPRWKLIRPALSGLVKATRAQDQTSQKRPLATSDTDSPTPKRVRREERQLEPTVRRIGGQSDKSLAQGRGAGRQDKMNTQSIVSTTSSSISTAVASASFAPSIAATSNVPSCSTSVAAGSSSTAVLTSFAAASSSMSNVVAPSSSATAVTPAHSTLDVKQLIALLINRLRGQNISPGAAFSALGIMYTKDPSGGLEAINAAKWDLDHRARAVLDMHDFLESWAVQTEGRSGANTRRSKAG